MKIVRNGETVKLWASARDTYDWAHKPGAWWPCSVVSGKRLFAEFYKGDLVDVALDGRDAEIPADEFNAITADLLCHAD